MVLRGGNEGVPLQPRAIEQSDDSTFGTTAGD